MTLDQAPLVSHVVDNAAKVLSVLYPVSWNQEIFVSVKVLLQQPPDCVPARIVHVGNPTPRF